jgi:hypothetical protein
VRDGLLVRPDEHSSTELDQDDAAYYFEVNVDHEIAPETLCAIIADLKAQGQDLGYLSDLDIDCPDTLTQGTAPFNVYGSNVNAEDIEECLD